MKYGEVYRDVLDDEVVMIVANEAVLILSTATEPMPPDPMDQAGQIRTGETASPFGRQENWERVG